MMRRLVFLLAVLLLGRVGMSFMPGGRYTAGIPITYRFNGHGQITRDAIRGGSLPAAATLARQEARGGAGGGGGGATGRSPRRATGGGGRAAGGGGAGRAVRAGKMAAGSIADFLARER